MTPITTAEAVGPLTPPPAGVPSGSLLHQDASSTIVLADGGTRVVKYHHGASAAPAIGDVRELVDVLERVRPSERSVLTRAFSWPLSVTDEGTGHIASCVMPIIPEGGWTTTSGTSSSGGRRPRRVEDLPTGPDGLPERALVLALGLDLLMVFDVLHDLGWTHGRVDADHVVVVEGRAPRVFVLGGDRIGRGRPEGDRRAVGRLVWLLLTGLDVDPDDVDARARAHAGDEAAAAAARLVVHGDRERFDALGAALCAALDGSTGAAVVAAAVGDGFARPLLRLARWGAERFDADAFARAEVRLALESERDGAEGLRRRVLATRLLGLRDGFRDDASSATRAAPPVDAAEVHARIAAADFEPLAANVIAGDLAGLVSPRMAQRIVAHALAMQLSVPGLMGRLELAAIPGGVHATVVWPASPLVDVGSVRVRVTNAFGSQELAPRWIVRAAGDRQTFPIVRVPAGSVVEVVVAFGARLSDGSRVVAARPVPMTRTLELPGVANSAPVGVDIPEAASIGRRSRLNRRTLALSAVVAIIVGLTMALAAFILLRPDGTEERTAESGDVRLEEATIEPPSRGLTVVRWALSPTAVGPSDRVVVWRLETAVDGDVRILAAWMDRGLGEVRLRARIPNDVDLRLVAVLEDGSELTVDVRRG